MSFLDILPIVWEPHYPYLYYTQHRDLHDVAFYQKTCKLQRYDDEVSVRRLASAGVVRKATPGMEEVQQAIVETLQ